VRLTICQPPATRQLTLSLPRQCWSHRDIDCYQDIKRIFPSVLDLGAQSLHLARALINPSFDETPATPSLPRLPNRITSLTCTDTSHSLLHRDDPLPFDVPFDLKREVISDLEYLPYPPGTFDAVLSNLSLHWINDLPSLLSQINSVMKPDSPFLAAMLGGDSLFELRTSLQLAEQDRLGGVSPHISPLADVRDVGGLLTRAGFKMLTVDVDDIIVEYPDIFALMMDLQAMGESNAVLRREIGPIGRDVLLAAEGIYKELQGEEGRDGIPATFRIIYMIGWTEGEGQTKPLERGSGQMNLKDVLGGGSIGGT
jgi:NADH dehydrogenase [ubiquinone] 1 alpha subcomplex assembly factor 5